MRHPHYLSPSAIAKFEESLEGYYLHYLTDNPPPREPQTQPMSIGSAFDAYAKAFLHDKLFGKNHADSNQFDFTAIFEAQVEPQHRAWALVEGKYVFALYQESGALLDLLSDLQRAKNSPRFEFEVKGQVNGQREGIDREMNGVVLLGKPDCYYTNSDGIHVVLDWKVNNYCSKWPSSPIPGYVRMRGLGGKSWGAHRDCSPFEVGSMTINIGGFLDHYKKDWARQLSIYAWLCGEPVGGDYIVAVDQMSCKPCAGARPTIRVAEHRIRVSPDFQWNEFRRASEIWEIVQSEYIFRDMTLEESQARCRVLDAQATHLYGDTSKEGDLFREMTRR